MWVYVTLSDINVFVCSVSSELVLLRRIVTSEIQYLSRPFNSTAPHCGGFCLFKLIYNEWFPTSPCNVHAVQTVLCFLHCSCKVTAYFTDLYPKLKGDFQGPQHDQEHIAWSTEILWPLKKQRKSSVNTWMKWRNSSVFVRILVHLGREEEKLFQLFLFNKCLFF